MANTNSESKRLRYNDGKKTALMLVDIQYDFLPGGALAVTDGDKILPVVYDLLDRFDWDLVVASAGGDFESGVQSRLDASPSKVAVIRKGSHLDIDSYSAFADNAYLVFTDLPKTLYSNGIERLVVVGLATDFCVRATAIDSRKFNFETIVIRDGIRGVFADREEAVLSELSSWGAKVQTLREYENEAS
ncbi:Cysteine hydrolase [Tulasnella sp. 408]|nr:Cysteine hydrolase [Tulasnella sp. 408]